MSAHKNPHFSDKEHLASAPVARRGQRLRVRAPGDGAAALGIYAKTASAPAKGPSLTWADTVEETGEIVPFERKGEGFKPHVSPQMARAERFALKAVVNKFMPASRTAKCMRWRVPKQVVQVLKSLEFNKAFYSGLQVCASVGVARSARARSPNAAALSWWARSPRQRAWAGKSCSLR